jgi:hypothetical protein
VALVGFSYGVAGNLVADMVPKPGWVKLVVLVVGLTLLVVGTSGRNQGLDSKAHTSGLPRVDPRNRPRLLTQVQARAKQQVEQALHHAVVLELGLETRSGLTEFPEDLLMRRIGEATAHPVPAGQPKLATFEDLDQAMLVLGEPGAGKTVWLNQLAVELAERAGADQEQPIPVVLNLASWAARRGPLEDWLVEELAVAYQLHPALGTNLVQAQLLLPLLDGLDEVPEQDRPACVAAINAYQQTRFRPLVVSSRRAEAEAAARLTRLRLTGAISLQPPSREAVTHYLKAASAYEVLDVLPARPDRDPELWSLLQSPLTLSIIALARTRAAAALRQPAPRRLDALLDAYIDTLLTPSDRGGRLRGILTARSPGQIRGWLAWLAASMNQHAMMEFYLERLQPTWVPSHRVRYIIRWAPGLATGLFGLLTSGLYGGLFFGLTGLIIGLIHGGLEAARRPNQGSYRSAWYGGLVGLLVGWLAVVCIQFETPIPDIVLFVGLMVGLAIGLMSQEGLQATTRPSQDSYRSVRYSGLFGLLVGILVVGLVGELSYPLFSPPFLALGGVAIVGLFDVAFGGTADHTIRPVETVQWSGKKGLISGLASGVVSGMAVIGLAVTDLPGPPGTGFNWLVVGLFGGLGGGLLGGLFGGLTPTALEGTTHPNQGIHRSVRYALLGTVVSLVLVDGLILGLWMMHAIAVGDARNGFASRWMIGVAEEGLIYAVLGSLAVGWFVGGAAAIQYYTVRLLLVLIHAIPLAYARFLGAAADNLLLRRTGGGYRFPHPLLQDRFATYPPTAPVASAPRGSRRPTTGSRIRPRRRRRDTSDGGWRRLSQFPTPTAGRRSSRRSGRHQRRGRRR